MGKKYPAMVMARVHLFLIKDVTLLSSVIAATQKVTANIFQDHMQGCIRDALTRNERSDEYMDELLAVIERFTLKK